jgi:hypothetical protein
MRNVFLALFATWAYTTAMTYEPEQQGYSLNDRAGMNHLIERVTIKPKHPGKWPQAKQRTALAELFVSN